MGLPAISVLGFHICIGRQQFLHDVLVALLGREVKWPLTSEGPSSWHGNSMELAWHLFCSCR